MKAISGDEIQIGINIDAFIWRELGWIFISPYRTIKKKKKFQIKTKTKTKTETTTTTTKEEENNTIFNS